VEEGRMGKNKYKDKMDLIYMLIGLTGIRNNIVSLLFMYCSLMFSVSLLFMYCSLMFSVSLLFIDVLSISVIVHVLFFDDSDYLFGIFKLFLYEDHYLVSQWRKVGWERTNTKIKWT
jgi:hypothetical protein